MGGLRREACLELGGVGGGLLASCRETGEGGGWLSLCDRTHLLSSRWNIPAVCGKRRCRWGVEGGLMTRFPLQALDSPSIAVRSGMSHTDAITTDLNPEVFLVLA